MQQPIKKVWLKPFDPVRDAEHLATWLRSEHVAKWWGNPKTQLNAVLERPVDGGDALIVADGVPVGYVRWQRVTRTELIAAGLEEIPDGTMDIDIAIGEPSYLGYGLGPSALKEVVGRNASHPANPMFMLVTSVKNARAIRAFEKAGFQRQRTFEDPECGTCWVMLFQEPSNNG